MLEKWVAQYGYERDREDLPAIPIWKSGHRRALQFAESLRRRKLSHLSSAAGGVQCAAASGILDYALITISGL